MFSKEFQPSLSVTFATQHLTISDLKLQLQRRCWLMIFAVICLGFTACQPSDELSYGTVRSGLHASGDVRGVSLFYLDGDIRHSIPWLLDHLEEPAVQSKLLTLFGIYQAAGVNWIRLLVSVEHFRFFDTATNSYRDYADIPGFDRTTHYNEVYPVPSAAIIAKVNRFFELASNFTIELMLIPQQDTQRIFTGAPYFVLDQFWYDKWLSQLHYNNLGMVMFGGDLQPCTATACQGDSWNTNPLNENHGAFIRAMWAYKDAIHPELQASYEVEGIPLQDNNPATLVRLSEWINNHTPSNPAVTASLYISGSSLDWVTWANDTQNILQTFRNYSNDHGYPRSLRIDEFGAYYQLGFDPNVPLTWLHFHSPAVQKAAIDGFLGASVCWSPYQYPKFAWVASPDPGEGDANHPDELRHYGLASEFNGSTPTMQPAWATISQYYNLAACP